MARNITNLSNVDAPDSDYTWGRVRNNPGDNTGTPVNEAMVGDVLNYHMKLADDAGITLNGLPDNENNGWQLSDVYYAAMFRSPQTPSYSGLFIDNTTAPIRFAKIGSKRVVIEGMTAYATGVGLVTDLPIFTLPLGYRPAKTKLFIVAQAGGAELYTLIEVATTGVVTLLASNVGTDSNGVYIQIDFSLEF